MGRIMSIPIFIYLGSQSMGKAFRRFLSPSRFGSFFQKFDLDFASPPLDPLGLFFIC